MNFPKSALDRLDVLPKNGLRGGMFRSLTKEIHMNYPAFEVIAGTPSLTNAPSKTGNPSGPGRGNNPPKGK